MELIFFLLIIVIAIFVFKNNNSFSLPQESYKKTEPEYIKIEKNNLIRYKEFFDNLFEYSLTQDQRKSIVCDADRLLSVASAGSGKTSTLVGKFAYLVKSKKAKESEILILSFNRSVKEELEKRLKQLGHNDAEIETFHSLGRKILKSANEPFQIDKMALGDGDSFLTSFQVKSLISKAEIKSPTIRLKIAEFTALTQYHLIENFAEDQNEYNEAISSYPYKRNKFKFNDEFRPLKIPALDGKTWVRSQQELFIANLLVLNGINFKYEAPLSVGENDSINPDFYYPDIDLWHEHYAIDEKGKSPFGEKYEENHKLKEEFYKRSSIKVFSTNLKDYSSGEIEHKIFSKLESNGLQKNPLSLLDIELKLKEIYTDSTHSLIANLIGLHKENNSSISETLSKLDSLHDQTRAQKFKEIFFPLLDAYQEILASNRTIDFSDMMTKANKIIEGNNKNNSDQTSIQNFKYILVDEFQDISKSREKLIKSILSCNKESKLFGVGDDWQSIYRFTGSDISIMTDFKNRFNFKKDKVEGDSNQPLFEIKERIEVMNISETHRFPDSIVKLSSEFIQKNPNQLKKEIKTDKKGGRIFLCKIEKYKTQDLKNILDHISSGKKKVFLLARKNQDIDNIDFEELKLYRPDLDIKFSSIHRVKGSERDVIIILGMDGGMFGLPRIFSEDPLVSIYLPKEDEFRDAEERRVLYVAMTRGREDIFLVSAPGKDYVFYNEPSVFYDEIKRICEKEFLPENNKIFNELDFTESIPCKVCANKKINQKMRIKTVRNTKKNIESGNFPGVFMGCSGFSKNIKSPTFCNHSERKAICINCYSKDKKNLSELEVIEEDENGRKKYFVFCSNCNFKKDYFYYQKISE